MSATRPQQLTVGALQVGPASATVEDTIKANLVAAERVLSENRIDFLLLPELSSTPYFCGSDDPRYFDQAEPIPGPTTEAFGELARRHSCHLVVPFFERCEDGRTFNSASVIDRSGHIVPGYLPDGGEVPAYRKVHLPANLDEITGRVRSDERRYFSPGPGFPVFRTEAATVGILICWDKRFTEAWRVLGLQGVDIVFNPICTWGRWRSETYQLELRAMALANQYVVAGCSKAGTEVLDERRDFGGGAHIAGADGGVLASAEVGVGRAAIGTIDLTEVDRVRSRMAIYQGRRPELYEPLTHSEAGRTGQRG